MSLRTLRDESALKKNSIEKKTMALFIRNRLQIKRLNFVVKNILGNTVILLQKSDN